MKKWAAVLLSALLLLALGGCGEAKSYTKDLFSMDTVMSLTVYGSDARDAAEAAATRITALEAELSVTKEDSEIARLNRDGRCALSDDAETLLTRSLALEEETGGAFSPALYSLVSLWGFTTGSYRVPADAEIQTVLAQIRAGSLTVADGTAIADGVQVDLGAVAKGYAAAEAAAVLKEQGVTSAVLSLGGNVQTVGLKPDGSLWHIGIRDPQNESENLGVLEVGETAVVTSGGYQRYFEEDGVRYIHIMDPATGYPADSGLSSVTIVTTDGFLADGLSTALYVMGLDRASEFWRGRDDFEAVLVTDGGEIYVTEGLQGSFSGGEFTVIAR
ncbi:MAG: FAD:protein FMN transferase [Oscillospiraceae bacterium]|nr:FAD:protein FMN transferase [Oscillospiraceae bacterium]